MRIGQVVFSKKGRDKGNAFIVMGIEDGYAFLVDGKIRPLAKPKKKKIKHLQVVNYITALLLEYGLSHGEEPIHSPLSGQVDEPIQSPTRGLQDADIRKELKAFNNSAIEKPISDGGNSIVKR